MKETHIRITENTSIRVSFLIKFQAETYDFIKKESLAQVFSCTFCKNSYKSFFTEHLRLTASVYTTLQKKSWGLVEFTTEVNAVNKDVLLNVSNPDYETML